MGSGSTSIANKGGDERVRAFVFIVPEHCNKARLDITIAKYAPCNFHKTRSNIGRIISLGKVSVNNEVIKKPSYLVSKGCIISVKNESQQHQLSVQMPIMHKKHLDIVFENESLAVINKPAGTIVHPSSNNKKCTIVDILIEKYGIEGLSNTRGEELAGIVHRLDKETSGLMVITKTNEAYESIRKQIEEKTCMRKYIAICHGIIRHTDGVLINKIVPDPQDYRKYIALNEEDKNGKLAIMHYKTKNTLCEGIFSVVEVNLQTGRKNQIRIQTFYAGNPIVGDKLYKLENDSIYHNKLKNISNEKVNAIKNCPRHMLHSYYIKFKDPLTNEKIECSIDIPEEMQTIIAELQK